MGLSFGNMFASLTLESASFMSGIEAARKQLAITQKSFATVGANMAKVGAVMTVGITAPFTALVSAAIPAAVESQQAMAQVNAALASMGPVAGRTADQLSDLAGKLQDTSNFDDDDIMKSVTANLLTFGKVQGEVFDRAEQSVVDISARMGTDLQSAAIMVGKALNDPVKGLKALSRAGIQFTADQQEAIKAMVASGDAAGAQKIMLGELERQFGGAAKAQRDATPTAAQDQAWRTFQENVGAVALKVMPAVTQAATGLLDAFNELPSGVQTGTIAVAGIGAALGPALGAIGLLVKGIGAALPLLQALPLLLTETAIPAVLSFGAVLLPIIAPIAAVAGAIALVVAAVNHWDEIKAAAARAVGYFQSLYTGAKPWIDRLTGILLAVLNPVKTVGDAFFHLYDRVVGHSYVPDMVDEIGDEMRRLDAEMVNPAKTATDATAQAFLALQQRVRPILDRLFPDRATMNRYKADLSDLTAFGKQAGWSPEQTAEAKRRLLIDAGGGNADAERTSIEEPTMPVLAPKTEMDAMSTALDKLLDKTKTANTGMIESFATMARDVAGSLQGLVSHLKSGDWLASLSSVLDLVGQVAGIIKGTGQSATRTFPIGGGAYGGARASGGPVLPGRQYLVGERGPEMLQMGSGAGRIVPSDQIGGMHRITIEPSPWFDVRAADAARPDIQNMGVRAAAGGASIAQSRAVRQQRRRLG